MKTLLPRTSVLALTVAFLALSAQAGHAINPQPLPPHHPPEHTMLVYLLSLVHLIHF